MLADLAVPPPLALHPTVHCVCIQITLCFRHGKKVITLTLSILRSSAGADGAVISFIGTVMLACWIINFTTSSRLERLP